MTDNNKAPASDVSGSDRAREEFEKWYRGLQRPDVPASFIDISLAAVFSDSGGIWDAYRAAFDSQRLALETLRKLLPYDEIDNVKGFHCACIYSNGTAETLQECEGHAKMRLALEEKDKTIEKMNCHLKSADYKCAYLVGTNQQLQSSIEEKDKELERLRSAYKEDHEKWIAYKNSDRVYVEQLQREVEMFKAGLQVADDKLIEVQGENTRLQSRVKELEANPKHDFFVCFECNARLDKTPTTGEQK